MKTKEEPSHLYNWLVNKCKRTLWRSESGLVLYEGEFITDTVLLPGEHEYTTLSVQFFAPSGKGPAYMRKAINKGARTAWALTQDLNTFATFGNKTE